MAEPRPDRPYVQFNFWVTIPGLDSPNEPAAGFQECSDIGTEVTIVEYRNGNDAFNNVRKIVGMNRLAQSQRLAEKRKYAKPANDAGDQGYIAIHAAAVDQGGAKQGPCRARFAPQWIFPRCGTIWASPADMRRTLASWR